MLELAVARTLYDRFPAFPEGRLAKIRAHVVSRASCAEVAEELDLAARLREAGAGLPPAEVERLATNRNVLAAVLEAAIAALYVEHGFDALAAAVVGAFEPQIQYALHNHVDHKTELQERSARAGRPVAYRVVDVAGPPHDRTFTVVVELAGEQVGTGTGRSKKDAEQAAARVGLGALVEPATS